MAKRTVELDDDDFHKPSLYFGIFIGIATSMMFALIIGGIFYPTSGQPRHVLPGEKFTCHQGKKGLVCQELGPNE